MMKLSSLQPNLKWCHWRDWSIRTRLLVMGIFPIVYLFVSLLTYSYFSRMNEVERELNVRAKTVALALADGVEHHLLEGNLQGIKQSMYALIQSDNSIFRIDIFDAQHRELSHVENAKRVQPQTGYVELAVRKQVMWVNLTDGSSSVNTTIHPANTDQKASLLGYVRITMTADYKLSMQRQRFLIESVMALLALGVSAALAWYLSDGLRQPLGRAMQALHQIRSGRVETQMRVDTGGEIGELQHSINRMAASLHEAQQYLESKVKERTRELQVSRDDALKANAEKRRLIHQVHSIVETERQSIAVEIHDELNASLIALRLQAERIVHTAEKAMQQNTGLTDLTEPGARQDLAEIASHAKQMIQQTLALYANGRNLVRRLRPEILELMGLRGAIEEMLRTYNASQSDCRFELLCETALLPLPHDIALSMYRVVQEAVSNVLKHAQAKQATITMRCETVGGQSYLCLDLYDNGQGFDPGNVQQGLGITGMRERVMILDGEFSLSSQMGRGCQLVVRIPLPEVT